LSLTCDRSVVFSTNKTDRHNITEVFLKVALSTINQQIKIKSGKTTIFCVLQIYVDYGSCWLILHSHTMLKISLGGTVCYGCLTPVSRKFQRKIISIFIDLITGPKIRHTKKTYKSLHIYKYNARNDLFSYWN
jgi:hypothetical protein